MTEHLGNPQISADGGSVKELVVDFSKLIALDADPKKQQSLRTILIEEEDKLARNRESLERREHLIRKGREQISKGRERISKGRERISKGREHLERLEATNPSHAAHYRRTVELMETIQQLFENFHRRVRDAFPYSVKLHNQVVGVCATLDEARQRAQQFADANPEVFVTVVGGREGGSETFYQEPC